MQHEQWIQNKNLINYYDKAFVSFRNAIILFVVMLLLFVMFRMLVMLLFFVLLRLIGVEPSMMFLVLVMLLFLMVFRMLVPFLATLVSHISLALTARTLGRVLIVICHKFKFKG